MNAVLSNTVLPVPRSSTRSFTELKITPVILVCIHNVGNSLITHELLHTVFSTYGKILRILVFEKSKKWKAFVEYSDPEAAVQARENLNEFLLFSDGTRLNIYHSNLPTIKFQNNNSGGVDYTLLEEQPLISYQKQGSLESFAKKNLNEGSNGINSPVKRNSDHHEENHYKSTSADTGSHSHSAHHSSIDEDKEDEILKIIEDHKETFAQDEEENQQDEDNEKDTFDFQKIFFSFQKFSSTPDFPPQTNSWESKPKNPFFTEPTMNNANQRLRSNNSYTHLEFNQNSFQASPPITRAGTFGELPSFNSFSTLPHFSSSNNLAQPKDSSFPYSHGMSSFGQMKNTLNPKFPSQPELGSHFNGNENQQNLVGLEKDLLARIMNKLQSPEFQEYAQMNPYSSFNLTDITQMNKEALLKLYSNLSTIVGKDSETKKCAVLHVNGLEHKDIRVQMLYNVFSNFGNITKIIFMRNKASALIEFENVDYAAVAKDYLNNIVFMGRPLRINYSNYPTIQIRNKQNKGPEETFIGNQRTFRFNKNKNISINPPSPVLHISNLVKEACKDQSTLRSCFEQYGRVEAIKFLFGDNGKNMCLLKMPSIEDALRAMAYLHDFEIGGRRIQISFTRSKI